MSWSYHQNGPVRICTEHNAMVVYRTLVCPLCRFLKELEELEAKAKSHEDQIAELKMIVEELRADYGLEKK